MTSESTSGEHHRIEPVRLLALSYQLILVLLLAWQYQIEEGYGFSRLLPLIFGGFIVHALTPYRFRRQLFLALSLASILVVIPFPHSVAVIAGGCGLVGIAHLPISLRWRSVVLITIGAGLAAFRGGFVDYGAWREFPTLVVPVLGAMFMFRLAVYLYDNQHPSKPASVSERLGYFFMMPNVCFLLFPVVDYSTYRRTYYDDSAADIYQKGVRLILRGVIHLVLYRLVYQYFVPSPGEVHGIFEVALASISLYALYLRVSGAFHLIVGVLCLFGFNLPETHNNYFLSSGVGDFWRRINIYWKDFMVKLIYLPVYMRLRHYGKLLAGVIATVAVFISTWALHSYQWFWIRGEFRVHVIDLVFWATLGALAVLKFRSEIKAVRPRSLKPQAFDARAAFLHASKVAATFLFMSALWAFWSSNSISDGLALLAKSSESPFWHYIAFSLVVLAVILGGTLVQYLKSRSAIGAIPLPQRAPLSYTTVIAGLLLLLTVPGVLDRASAETSAVVTALRADKLNVRDRELAARGHYEGLMDAGEFTSTLWSNHLGKPKGVEWEVLGNSNVSERTEDEFEHRLKRSFQGTWKDAEFSTNQWGMRDKDYPKLKPVSAFRVALVGSSSEVGAGVRNHETTQAVLEQRMNQSKSGHNLDSSEILNFSVGGYTLFHKALVIERLVPEFSPDVVWLTVYPMGSTRTRLIQYFANRLKHGELVRPFLVDLAQRSGATAEMSIDEIRVKLTPLNHEIVLWCFERIQSYCKQQELEVVVIFLPMVREETAEDRSILFRWWQTAQKSGISSVRIDSSELYGDRDRELLQIAPWDTHPNAEAHHLRADALYRLMCEK